jgi:hypothetical protein
MARETKAQREARLEAERLELVAVAKMTYTERMMALMARATKENFELTVDSDANEFKLSDRDSRFRNEYWVRPVWAEVADVQLYELEMAVEDKEEARAEREKRANVRATALAKLTTEERAELGL